MSDYKGAKLLILGLPNAGKTTIVKDIPNSFTIAYDGKTYPFEKPHSELPNGLDAVGVCNFINEKLEAYANKFGKEPETLIIDAVSRVFHSLEAYCAAKYTGFNIWSNLNKEINTFVDYLHTEIIGTGLNLILIGHAKYDQDSALFKEVLSGKFADTGFISTTDECLFLEVKGSQRIAHHRNMALARTFVEDLPDKEPVDTAKFKEYWAKLIERQHKLNENKWSI